MIGSLTLDTYENLQKGLAAHGEELIADIANYTNVQAQMFLSRVVEPVTTSASAAAV